ncbi:MAG: hypothetical protein A2V67_05570 [Deltaproteobacteria bacterium RBG_13_61_14]|nr:MAG: hypothetical protein A2V67_05570 [Deltaproteobacteria bacterium RBG_13_61_14]
MKVKGGYFWKALFVDLSAGQAFGLPFDEEFAKKYIGGRGFNIKFLWDNLRRHKFKINPFGPENVICMSPGPLGGTYTVAAGKTSFATISPATGIYGDSSMGGVFGPEFRQTGHDALILSGRAPELSYLLIDGAKVRIVPFPELKGKSALEAEGMIRQQTGDQDLKIAVIGPAGENRVVFACVNSDWSRNAGRVGIGAVLGSKNLKAIAVRGACDLPVAEVGQLMEITNAGFARLKSHKLFSFWQEQGLMSVVDYVNGIGVMPTYNFKDAHFDRADQINGFVMEERYKIGDTACFCCPMSCGNACLVKEGKYSGAVCEGPEYETACMFGSNLGIDNFAFIVRANQLCDELGIDTISTANLIGVMIEAVTSDLVPVEEVDGLALEWGDEEGVITLMHKIANREGVGDTLAGGSKAVIARWPRLKPIISQVKGLEQSAYDARTAVSMALAYATSDIGAHHTRAWTLAHEMEQGLNWSPEKKVDLVMYHQTVRPLFDMLGVCRLPWIELGFPEDYYEQAYQAVTGVKYSLQDLLAKSALLYDLTRLIGVKLGISRQDDQPPDRTFDQPVLSGPQKGKVVRREDFEELLELYYRKRGWDQNGIPPQEREREFSEPLVSE